MIRGKNGWIKLVDEKLEKSLELAADAAYSNECPKPLAERAVHLHLRFYPVH